MKTKEFIKKVEGLGYKAYLTHTGLWVEEGSELRAVAYVNFEGHFHLNTQDFNFAKLCIEYAETPIAEREEVKKYTVVLPDPRNEKDVMFMLTKRVGIAIIGWCHKAHLEGLTEAEIKRNHEYLWQFAKEVE